MIHIGTFPFVLFPFQALSHNFRLDIRNPSTLESFPSMPAPGSAPSKLSDTILIRGAKQVVTLQGPARMRQGAELRELGLIRDGSILIQNGMITQVGSSRRIENLKESAHARTLDARNMIVLPAFLDSVRDLLPLEAPLEAASLSANRPGSTDSGADDSEPFYTFHALNTVVRRLEREVQRLEREGTLFSQFQLRFPHQPALQSRLLRNLLQLDLQRQSFRATLHFDRIPDLPAGNGAPFSHRLPRAARGFWKQLHPSIAVSIRSAALAELSPAEQIRKLRLLSDGLPAFLVDPEALTTQNLVDLCLGTGTSVMGVPPAAQNEQEIFARLAVPWLVPAAALVFSASSEIANLQNAIRSGMCLALCSGLDVNARGVSSPMAASAVLRQNGGIFVEDLLQLSIANLAFALGVGDRLGSIEAGKEGNLVLLDCDDYREIGTQLGMPSVRGILRRGILTNDCLRFHG